MCHLNLWCLNEMLDENRLLWNSAPIGMARVSRLGQFLAVNTAYCAIVGYNETELIGRTFQSITHPDAVDSDSAEAAALASSTDEDRYTMAKRYIRKDGRVIWVNLFVYAVRKEDGAFRHFLSFAIELQPLGVHPQNQPAAKSSSNLIDCIKANPREFLYLVALIVALARGHDLLSILRTFTFK